VSDRIGVAADRIGVAADQIGGDSASLTALKYESETP